MTFYASVEVRPLSGEQAVLSEFQQNAANVPLNWMKILQPYNVLEPRLTNYLNTSNYPHTCSIR
jgi:hypothetical protein